MTETAWGLPAAQGLYDPSHEHDARGVGFVVDIKGRKSHAIVSQALTVLDPLRHTSLGHLVLGTDFDPRDFASYAAGVIVAGLMGRARSRGVRRDVRYGR